MRFLQERTIERIGGRTEIPVDIRVVCATHQDLQQLITEGRFREDLYYRLSEMTIEIPPLKDREGDAIVIGTALAKRTMEKVKQLQPHYCELDTHEDWLVAFYERLGFEVSDGPWLEHRPTGDRLGAYVEKRRKQLSRNRKCEQGGCS